MSTPPVTWLDLEDDQGLHLRDLVDPPFVVDGSTTCEVVDRELQHRWSTTSVLVRDPERGPLPGIVSRDDFIGTMTGNFGYGRSLWHRRPIAEVADWEPRVIHEDMPLTQAAALLTAGSRKEQYADLVVLDIHGEAIGILRPTTVMEALADRFARHASRDALTGITSRAAFMARLDRMCDFAHAGDLVLVLAFVDLDHLKEVNDSNGHGAGDALLRAVADRLTRQLEPDDLLGRLGGDEFAVARLIPASGTDLDALAFTFADRLRRSAREDHGGARTTTASVGVVIADQRSTRVDLLRAADTAMYSAKRRGGDLVAVSRASASVLRPASMTPSGIVLGMRADGHPAALLLPGRLEVHFQPILGSGRRPVASVEALLRHRDEDGALRGPVEALAAAATEDLCLTLDLWVLDRAARAMVAWRRDLGAVAPKFLDVNLSPTSVSEPGMVDAVLAVIDRSGLPRECVRLELPEACSLDDLQAARDSLDTLRAAGVRLTLDDVGSALTGVRHLTHLPIDGIKLDRWLISDADEPATARLISLLVDLAAERGLPVTAEGVETPEQLRAVLALGVDHVQGYLLARPMPADAVSQWLSREPRMPSQRQATELSPSERLAVAAGAVEVRTA